MAVTPLVATGRLVISYTSDLPHKLQLLCNVINSAGTWKISDDGGVLYDPATIATTYVTFAKPAFSTASTFVGWLLERYSGGAYIEVASGSLGIAGTALNPAGAANQFTFVFRDRNNDIIKNVWLGVQSQFVPIKLGYGDLSGATLAFVNEMMDGSSGGHLGATITGRSGLNAKSFTSLVGALNRKARRRLGVA
jgi:hypothetical protein